MIRTVDLARAMRVNVWRRVFSSASAPKAGFVRHPIPWTTAEYYDHDSLESEMRRVLDVCHGCRRCFNLCDSFPTLFSLIDESPTSELDSVPSKDFKPVVDACTLCDMCFVAKCPYVPPHPLDIDLPHLILRYRAWENASHNKAAVVEEDKPSKSTKASATHASPSVLPGVSRELVASPRPAVRRLMSKQDLVGPLGRRGAPLINAATRGKRGLARRALEAVAGVDARAPLPPYASKSFGQTFTPSQGTSGRKVVFYSTCLVENHKANIGEAASELLKQSGVTVELCFPECCGMPQFEQGLVAEVSEKAKRVTQQLASYVDRGFDVVSLTPSCTLMLRSEWPLLLPNDENVKKVACATKEVSEYLWDMQRKGELGGGKNPQAVDALVTLHNACHSRAQNIGFKAKELLSVIPGLRVSVTERCSGHGGFWGFEKEHYDQAHKVGAPVVAKAAQDAEQCARDGKKHVVVSECPMAADHIMDGLSTRGAQSKLMHPVEIVAQSFTSLKT